MSRFLWFLIGAGTFTVNGCEEKSPVHPPRKVTSENVHGDRRQTLTSEVDASRQSKESLQNEGRLTQFDAELMKLREKGTGRRASHWPGDKASRLRSPHQLGTGVD